jgi:hypothetical protein
MNAAERMNLRVGVLKVLQANQSRYGLGVDAITLHVSTLGFGRITAPEVEAAMIALEEGGMIARLSEPLRPGTAVFRITDEGRSYLAENF